jgi:ankyrin repeat protein
MPGSEKPTSAALQKELYAAVHAKDAKPLEEIFTGGDERQRLATTVINLPVEGKTLLYTACFKPDARVEVVNSLIKRGAYVDSKSGNAGTALHGVVGSGNPTVTTAAIVRLFLAVGADVNARDGSGNTPLHVAISCKRDIVVIRILLEAKAKVNAKNKLGRTALHDATDQPGILDLMLRSQADPRLCANDGWTPLHVAVSSGQVDSAIKLLLHGADPFKTTSHGETAFDIGTRRGDFTIVKVMIDHVIEKGHDASGEHTHTSWFSDPHHSSE